jgi:putative phage-type endonuclease
MTIDQYAKIDTCTYTTDDGDRDADAAEPTETRILPTDEDRETIINDALDELADIARENILEFKREDFNTEEVVGQWIDSYLCNYFAEVAIIDTLRSDYSTATAAEAEALNDVFDTYIRELYDEITERFYDEIVPLRAETADTDPDRDRDRDRDTDIKTMTAKIRTLQRKPQPEQRTPEWYARRNNLITASAASKAFGTQASINQLIYEKCKNYDSGSGSGSNEHSSSVAPAPSTGFALQGPINSPLHWGQRYEPVTVMVYEHRNKTKLGEFGCIQHDKYSFLGASPDGINIEPDSPIYGRMVEIKNIFNREITGQPKEEYWIQTQLQMEVCDLDECDFVETRFKEFESEEDFLAADGNGNEKGRILWFQSAPTLTEYGNIATPIQLYEYAPIEISDKEYEEWEAAVFAKHERERNIWVRTIYWRLDEYSCVLVRRNRLWFEEAVKVLESVWRTIEHERETGYEHRAPIKRKSPPSNTSTSTSTSTSGGNDTVYKIVKLDTAIIPEPDNGSTGGGGGSVIEATATNMAALMSMTTAAAATATTTTRAGYKKYASTAASTAPKRPSDVLIHCFKIDDLEIDESRVEQ